MDVLDLKHHYENLRDDEILRLWADKEGLTQLAVTVLSEEVSKRGILGDPQSLARVTELKQELVQNQKRFERHQKRVVWHRLIWLFAYAVIFLSAFVEVLLKKMPMLLPLLLILLIFSVPVYLIVRAVRMGKQAGEELVGIHGWLWWFVYICVGVGGVVSNAFLALFYLSKHDEWAAIVSVVFVAVALRAVMLLHKVDSRGLFWSKVYLLTVFGSESAQHVLPRASRSPETVGNGSSGR
jgi:hypothetical protein